MLLPYTSSVMAPGSSGGTLPAGGVMPLVNPDIQAEGAQQQALAKIAGNFSIFPAQLQQNRFNQLFPWLQNQFSTASSAGGMGGAQVGNQPFINTGGVYTPGQVQQQVNTSQAKTNQTAGGQMQQQRAQTASQGFGANSPLLSALQGATQNNALATNVGNETAIRQGAAQQNAQQQLSGQTAAENQFANRQNEQIKRAQINTGYRSSLLSALSGLL